MAARTPRRSFATPFVVTLAAAPACYVQSTPPQQPTTVTTQPTTQPDPGKPTTPTTNPPRPQATTPNARWRIYKDGATCYSAYKIECQPGVSCNPPRPKPYTCPTDIELGAAGPVEITSSQDGMNCWVDWGPQECPAGASCNPPPPVKVNCPAP